MGLVRLGYGNKTRFLKVGFFPCFFGVVRDYTSILGLIMRTRIFLFTLGLKDTEMNELSTSPHAHLT